MKLGVIIPTRGDRPALLAHALTLLGRQTREPDELFVIDDKPSGPGIDTGKRIRSGLKRSLDSGMDHVAIWEDDDWYRQEYLQFVADHAQGFGLFGFNTTWYFHLKTHQIWESVHPEHTSAHAMTLTPEPFLSSFPWPEEGKEPKGMDGRLTRWANSGNTTTQYEDVKDSPPFVISMKHHGEGLWAGGGHRPAWPHWQENSQGLGWLRDRIPDSDEFEFYKSLHKDAAV